MNDIGHNIIEALSKTRIQSKKGHAMSERGHNSVEASQLRAFIERIEHVHQERDVLSGDLKDIYAEAKGTGYDTKILKRVVALCRMDKESRDSEAAILELYCSAVGM